jgi:hypothetical protein
MECNWHCLQLLLLVLGLPWLELLLQLLLLLLCLHKLLAQQLLEQQLLEQ